MEDAILEIMNKQKAVMDRLIEFLAQGAGMTPDEVHDLAALVRDVSYSIKRAMAHSL